MGFNAFFGYQRSLKAILWGLWLSSLQTKVVWAVSLEPKQLPTDPPPYTQPPSTVRVQWERHMLCCQDSLFLSVHNIGRKKGTFDKSNSNWKKLLMLLWGSVEIYLTLRGVLNSGFFSLLHHKEKTSCLKGSLWEHRSNSNLLLTLKDALFLKCICLLFISEKKSHFEWLIN